MFFKISFHPDFEQLMHNLWSMYGKELFDIDGIGKQTDMRDFTSKFFGGGLGTTADASVDSNSNVTDLNVIAYLHEFPKPFMRYYSYYRLWEALVESKGRDFANRAIESQLIGDIYINDFTDVQRPYCFNYSTMDILFDGLPMISKIKSVQPRYLYSFKSQLEQFVTYASNSTLGACGIADVFITISHFVKKILQTGHDAGFYFDGWLNDNERAVIEPLFGLIPERKSDGSNDAEIEAATAEIKKRLGKEKAASPVWFKRNVLKYVKENIVSFIYTINQPMRGNQSPFTNVSVYDRYFLETLCEGIVFPDGSTPDMDLIREIQGVYLDVMNAELQRTPVTFPVTTACFSIAHDRSIRDEEFARFVAEKNYEFGFINIYHGESSTLSSCCRLRSETKSEYFNSFGAGSTKIGSLGVVTANLPRLAWRSGGDEPLFFKNLAKMTELIGEINNAKRNIVRSQAEKGALPLYALGYMDLKKQYSTFGATGIYEMCKIMGHDMLEPEGQDFVIKCFQVVNSVNEALEKKYKAPHNCEQVPAENSSIKLVQKDNFLGFNDEGYELYSNQFIPLTSDADMLDRIYLQGKFDGQFTGGAICHINVEQRPKSPDFDFELIKSCAKAGVIYWARNSNLQECANGHMTVGRNETCPKCGAPIENNYTRVVGFLTAVRHWHKVRREVDYPHRKFY